MNKRTIGRHGEDLASDFLAKNGYLLLAKNAHERYGEIDLIAQDPQTQELVFVEVKFRKSEAFGLSEEAIDHRKMKHLVKAAVRWLEGKKEENFPWRIDLIAIQQEREKIEIKHLKDITAEWF